MALVQVSYAVGVLEGKAAGITVGTTSGRDSSGRFIAEALLETISKKEMAKRIAGLMQDVSRALKLYVKLQFETSGGGMSKIAASQGWTGGSSEPWIPLATATLEARARKRGYYGLTKGKSEFKKGKKNDVGVDSDAGYGMDPALAMEMKEEASKASASPADVKPRLWTKRGMKIAMDGINLSGQAVKVRITETTMRYNEATRPVFVLSEIFTLTQKLAEKNFANLRRKYDAKQDQSFPEAAVDVGSAPFSMKVGEKRPFERDKVGRPKGLGSISKLLSKSDRARLAKGAKLAKIREAIHRRQAKRKGFLADLQNEDFDSAGD